MKTFILSKHTPELTNTHLTEIQKKKHFKNPSIGYLNINSLRNKITDITDVAKYLELDYIVISETKMMKAFHISNFLSTILRLGKGKIGV